MEYAASEASLHGAIVSDGVRAVLETPTFRFLRVPSRFRAAPVCKLWWHELYGREHLRQLIRAASLPEELRAATWRAMLRREVALSSSQVQEYSRLHAKPCAYDDEIRRDVGRTFPHSALFQGEYRNSLGQQAMLRVLRATATKNTELGYCQGMNFLAAMLLHIQQATSVQKEAVVFWCLDSLLWGDHDMARFFLPEFPRLGVTVFSFDALVRWQLPDLAEKFADNGITSQYYAMHWWLTIFSDDLRYDLSAVVWDHVMVDGMKAVCRAGLTLLAENRKKILEAEDEDRLLRDLRSFTRSEGLDGLSAAAMGAAMMQYKVSNGLLRELSERHEQRQPAVIKGDRQGRGRLTPAEGDWTDDITGGWYEEFESNVKEVWTGLFNWD